MRTFDINIEEIDINGNYEYIPNLTIYENNVKVGGVIMKGLTNAENRGQAWITCGWPGMYPNDPDRWR